MVGNRWHLPNLGLGIGLRGPHIPHLLNESTAVQWLEVITDNHLIHQGQLLRVLDRLRERYPIVLHGVTLNIGSIDPLDRDYLQRLKGLAERVQTPWVSDHICFTGVDGRQTHDLLPLPWTESNLRWLAARVRQVQDLLERPLVLENPSSYMTFHQTTMPEWEFVARLAEAADCGLLLDVNNVYVAAHNHGFEPQRYLDAMPWDRVVQLHIAGHSTEATHLLDTHVGPVVEPVWQLYREAWRRSGGRATLYEWDAEIPPFEVLWSEACKARDVVADVPTLGVPSGAPAGYGREVLAPMTPPVELAELQRWLVDGIVSGQAVHNADRHVASTGELSAAERVGIHRRMFQTRCDDALAEDFPRTQALLGRRWLQVVAAYRQAQPSTHWALELYGRKFAEEVAREFDGPRSPGGQRWAADVARLEWARIEATLAPTEGPLWAESLAGLTPERLATMRLRFAPSLRLLQVSAAALAWLRSDRALGRSRLQVAVWRCGAQVEERALGRDEARALNALLGGATLAEVVGQAPTAGARLGAWLQAWTADGRLVGLEAA